MSYEFRKGYRENNWRKKRETILRRDDYTCQCCGRTEQDGIKLQVHHLIYLRHCKPWEYPDYALQTLCSGCHAREHGHKPPTSGWIYDYEYDYGEYGAEQCELCGTDLLHVHVLNHPNWGNIKVGIECKGKLLAGDNRAEELQKERESRARKLKTFVNSPKWRNYKNGYFYKKGDEEICIWDNNQYFSVTYKSSKEDQPYRIKSSFKTIELAKTCAFETLFPSTIQESRTYPKEDVIVCNQPTNIFDRKNLIRNICIQAIKKYEFILPAYGKIPSHGVTFRLVRQFQPNENFKYDICASLFGKKDNIMYDFYIRFLFNEQVSEQEINAIREKNVQYITVDCSPLLSQDRISMPIVTKFLQGTDAIHSQWIHSPIYDRIS